MQGAHANGGIDVPAADVLIDRRAAPDRRPLVGIDGDVPANGPAVESPGDVAGET